jgi:hypothetical protein
LQSAYIIREEMAQLQREVSEFEPHLAFYTGVDGQDFIGQAHAGVAAQ